jgi:hypothetical protein
LKPIKESKLKESKLQQPTESALVASLKQQLVRKEAEFALKISELQRMLFQEFSEGEGNL